MDNKKGKLKGSIPTGLNAKGTLKGVDKSEKFFSCLADKNRLRILNILCIYGCALITDLTNIFEFTRTKTIRHLQYLMMHGIIAKNSHGDLFQIYYLKNYRKLIKDILQEINDLQLVDDKAKYIELYKNKDLSINRIPEKQLKKYNKE